MCGAFVSKNADPDFAATVKSTLFAFGTFSILISRTVFLKIADYFNYYFFSLTGLGFQILFLLATIIFVRKMDSLPLEAFYLREKKNEEQNIELNKAEPLEEIDQTEAETEREAQNSRHVTLGTQLGGPTFMRRVIGES